MIQHATPLRNGFKLHLRQRSFDDPLFSKDSFPIENPTEDISFAMSDCSFQILKKVSALTISAEKSELLTKHSSTLTANSNTHISTPSPSKGKYVRHKRKPSWSDSNCSLLRTPTTTQERVSLSPPPLLISSISTREVISHTQHKKDISLDSNKRQRRSIIAHHNKTSGGRDNGMSKSLNCSYSDRIGHCYDSFNPQIPILDDYLTIQNTENKTQMSPENMPMTTTKPFKLPPFLSISPSQHFCNNNDEINEIPKNDTKNLFSLTPLSTSDCGCRKFNLGTNVILPCCQKIGLMKSSSFAALVSDSSRSCTPEPISNDSDDNANTTKPIKPYAFGCSLDNRYLCTTRKNTKPRRPKKLQS